MMLSVFTKTFGRPNATKPQCLMVKIGKFSRPTSGDFLRTLQQPLGTGKTYAASSVHLGIAVHDTLPIGRCHGCGWGIGSMRDDG